MAGLLSLQVRKSWEKTMFSFSREREIFGTQYSKRTNRSFAGSSLKQLTHDVSGETRKRKRLMQPALPFLSSVSSQFRTTMPSKAKGTLFFSWMLWIHLIWTVCPYPLLKRKWTQTSCQNQLITRRTGTRESPAIGYSTKRHAPCVECEQWA